MISRIDHSITQPVSLTTLRRLEERLDDGYQRIEEGLRRGEDVERWEAFWLDLLRQYETLVDSFRATSELAEAA